MEIRIKKKLKLWRRGDEFMRDFEDILLKILSQGEVKNWSRLAVTEIGFQIFKERFSVRGEYDQFFEKLQKDSKKFDKFEQVVKFYYFWCKRPSVYKFIKPDFKLIVMFSIIEFLMSDTEFQTLDNWLKKEMKRNQFIIKDGDSLNKVLEKYYEEYGTKYKVLSFFDKYYSSASLEKLKKSIRIFDQKKGRNKCSISVRRLVDFIIHIRNLFIHRARDIRISSKKDYEKEAEEYTHLSYSLFEPIKGKVYEINLELFHIEELLFGFEQGLLKFFQDN